MAIPTRIRRRLLLAATALLLALAGPALPGVGPSVQADGGAEQTAPILVPPDWSLRPGGVRVGGEFRLILVTRAKRDSMSADIADYDAHVQADVAASYAHPDIRPYADQFRVIGSTNTVAARDHIGAGLANRPGARIYWLDGALVARDYDRFFSGEWNSLEARRADGETIPTNQNMSWYILTGTTNDGTSAHPRTLGTTQQLYGRLRIAVGHLSDGDVLDDYGWEVAPESIRPLYAISPVFRVLEAGTPYVAGTEIISDAGPDGDYGPGDVIRVTATFDQAVDVTGQPQVELRLGMDNDYQPPAGSTPGMATYVAADSTSTELVFAYTVSAGDRDNDGVSIARGSIRLNGGTIKKQGASVDANLYNAILLDRPQHRVNCIPYVAGRSVRSNPRASADEYGLGETIELGVRFSEPIYVNTDGGRPELGVQVGTSRVRAAYRRVDGSTIVFGHVVAEGQLDVDGIRIKTNQLWLNGATIRSVATGRDADVMYRSADFVDHMVDAGLTPPTSGDASLSGLDLTGVVLQPAFDPDVTEYMGTAPSTVSETTIHAPPGHAGAAVTYSVADSNAETDGRQAGLSVGKTTLAVSVRSEDDVATKTYTVHVVRRMAGALPDVSIEAADSSVTEGTAATFTLTRTAPDAEALTVSLEVSQSGAVIATENEYRPPSEVSFEAGATTATLTVSTQPDTMDEPDGMLTAALMPLATYTADTTPSAQVVVSDDDDTPSVTLLLDPASIVENGGASTLTATLDHPSSAATTLAISVAPVEPASTGDFTLGSTRSLSIPAGETASSGTVTIEAVDNSLGAASKVVTVSATATNAQGVNAPPSVDVTITDDESAPDAPMNLAATAGDGQITLAWDAPDSGADITGHEYRYARGSAPYRGWTGIDQSAPGEAGDDGVTVTGLDNGSAYTFQVRAVNSHGASEPSMSAGARSGAGLGICDRTDQVRDGILLLIDEDDVSDCADVLDTHLAQVTGTLRLAHTGITSLRPGDFGGLSGLTTLKLYSDPLPSLPDGMFSDLSSLTHLELHHNQFTELSAGTFTGLDSLTDLDLSHNRITSIDDSALSGLTTLENLDLSYNKVLAITDSTFSGLTSLQVLDLDTNMLSGLPDRAFSDLSSLETLKLGDNRISTLTPAMFDGLSSITNLSLIGNEFTVHRMHAPFGELSTLEALNIEFGWIQDTFPTDLFKNLTSLTSVLAMGNYREGHILDLPVRLEVTDGGELAVRARSGAPFTIVVPVRITNGSLAGGATSLTIPVGKTGSEAVAFSRTEGTTGAVIAELGQLPPLPSTTSEGGLPLHDGYRITAARGNDSERLELIAALPLIRLSLSPGAVLESDDSATTTVNEARTTVTASLARPVATAFTVTIAVAPVGSATDGDYTLSSNTTLSFAANSRTSTGAVTITAVDDDAATGDSAYTVSGTLSAAVADGPSPLTLTIHDDEPPPAPAGLSAVAGDGELRLQWKASAPDDGIDGYEYRYREESAADYPATWSSVGDGYRGYSDGSSRRGYRVRGLTNDVAYRVQVRAVNMAGAGGAAATSDATTPLEPPRVELTLSRTTITEQDDLLTAVNESVATVTATVTRAVSVPFTVTVTATDSSRYVFSADRLLSFAADSTTSTGVVTLSAVPSTASEPDVTVTVSADVSAAGLAAEVAAPEGVALTIVDEENMAPTSTDATVSTAEDTGYVFQASDFPFSDGDTGDALASVGILDLPRSGALRFGDAALSEGYKIAASELGELIFAPAPNAHGSGYASFRFTVSDGEASSTVTSTMTIAVTEENDPPLFEGASTLSAMEGQTDAGLVVAGDVDRGDSVHYAITGGADSDAFAIDAGSGRLTFTTAPDFDSPSDQASTAPANAAGNNQYVVVITATGGSGPRALTAEATFIVAVSEAVETPGGEREVSSVTITSAPGDDGFYAVGDVVTIDVTFSGVVAVEPTPRVGVGLSTTTANDSESILSAGSACYASGSGTASLLFRYAVREGQQGRLVARALVADDEGEPGTGTIYSGTMDNVADLAFEATAAVDSQAVDGVRPVLASSRIAEDRLTIILKFSENLSATTAPASAFTVTVGDETAAVSSVAASGREVTLTLASAVGSGERVDVAYSEPTENTQPPADEVCGLDFAGDDANAVQDVAGNDARSFGVVVDPGAAPLTATFVDMPAEHDGRATFSFRLSFSEAIATSYVWVRDTAMNVSGGSVTSVHRVQGRSDLWNVTVQPSGRGDIAVTLPARTSCSNPNTVICTRDRRPLSAGTTAAVAGPPGEPEPLTAAFTSIPREHDGATPFSVRIQFSSPISVSFVTLEERSVTAANGAVTAARRVDGQGDVWEVDIAPDWYQDVTVTLAADEGCGGANAVCTSDARALTNAPSITIKSRPQPWLSIGDASADEGAGATLTFRVTLSHAAPVPVTVDYATTDGQATAGDDYTATSGTLTFAPGELTRTVSVTVLDDSNDEGSFGVEAMRLLLTSATGASIRDAAGVGYIRDTN